MTAAEWEHLYNSLQDDYDDLKEKYDILINNATREDKIYDAVAAMIGMGDADEE